MNALASGDVMERFWLGAGACAKTKVEKNTVKATHTCTTPRNGNKPFRMNFAVISRLDLRRKSMGALASGKQFIEERLNRSRRSPVGHCVIGYTCLLPRGRLVCETVHGFAVDEKLPIYSRMSHLFRE